MNNTIVELYNVTKSFVETRGGKPIEAVRNVSLTIPKVYTSAYDDEFQEDRSSPSQFVVLLGPSGCGKSTLLNMISGLIPADAGELYVCGNKVVGPNEDSASVCQAYTCFPWLTVLQNVEFGLAIKGVSKKERAQRARKYLNDVGLADRAKSKPRQLSGGMQQRVAIARTLAIRPRVVLMDEPFGALDAQTRADMQNMLIELWKTERNVIIFVTHDINEALLLGDRIIIFSPRPAEIVYDYPVDLPRPRKVSDKDFIRQGEILLSWLQPNRNRTSFQRQETPPQRHQPEATAVVVETLLPPTSPVMTDGPLAEADM